MKKVLRKPSNLSLKLQRGTCRSLDAYEFKETDCDIELSVKTGSWAGDCFIYTNGSNRLNYLVGSQVYTISHSDK